MIVNRLGSFFYLTEQVGYETHGLEQRSAVLVSLFFPK